MKKLMQTYIFNLIAAVALLSGMVSCTDDTDMPQAIDDGTTSITLRIPNPESAAEFARSRAATGDPDPSQNAEEGEGAIKSLWLLAYPTDGTGSVVRKLQSSGQVTNEYSDYKITMKPGDYRLYVVANLDNYITAPISTTTDEEELQSLVLNFSPKKLPNLSDGLPMACLPSEIDEAGDDGTVAIAPGHNVTVHADMTFLCAKVRYTIMFDNSEDGFSRPAFGDNTVTVSDGSFSGVIASTSLITPTTTTTEGAFEIDPAPLAAGETTPNTRSWQGTVYLPENLLTGKDRTLLHLNATLDINDTPLSYTVPLPSPDADKETAEAKTALKRGHFYDLTGRITTLGDKLDLTAEVKDWTLLTLTYDLHGPYFLHVEKTAVEIYAGIETLIPYDTDAGQLTFTSEMYPDPVKDPGVTLPGGPLPLLVCETVERDGKQYISVNVNPAIPAENRQLENRYFDIHAANLTKRINATIVSLKPFFNVSPTEIEVNIREYIASGEYEAEIPISFSTNLSKVTITGYDSFCGSMTLDGDKTYTGAKEGKNILKITGLNGGTDWTETKTFTLTYTAEGYPNPIQVTITVKPNILNYLIHFRAPADWDFPHIYVYQCLQLPSNRPDQYKGKTVGYYDLYNGEKHYLSALEYSFTGKIVFKGWNYSSPSDPNYYNQTGGSYEEGFYIFDKNQEEWNFLNDNNKKHYNTIDFCSTYRDSISNTEGKYPTIRTVCGYCGAEHINKKENNVYNNGYNAMWPGIQMRKDGNGWWTFELSGAATPGKALIMFHDGHFEGGGRYPESLKPGIPLFDYPNREGWLDYAASGDKAQFTNTKPSQLRIYWPDNNSNQAPYIHVWTDDWTTVFNDNKGYIDKESGYYYFDFSMKSSWSENTKIHAMLYHNDSKQTEYTISQFTDIGNNTRAITIKSDTSFDNSGKPGNSTPFEAKTYRIYWKDQIFDHCHVWWISPAGEKLNPAAPTWGSDAQKYTGEEMRNGTNYRYFQFKSTKDWQPDKISFVIYQGSNSNNKTGDQKDKAFNINSSSDRAYDYYYEYN